MIGKTIAADLSTDFSVTVFDLDAQQLNLAKEKAPAIEIAAADFAAFNEYSQWLSSFDLVVTAVPGAIGYKTLEAVIRAGKNVVDISFFPEDALQLVSLAKQNDVTVITDCGIAPGMSNLILGHYNETIKIDSFACYVGGLPEEPKPPFFYTAPFSPADVIQEYIRPARIIEHGEIVTRPPLSERELINFGSIGKLEAFNTDGLRSLIYTMNHIPELKEKTLRYPGHADLIVALHQAGFFDTQLLRINDTDVSPFDFTSKLLIKAWLPSPADKEFTVMRVIIKGEGKTISYDLLDRFDTVTQTSSMARTTGFTCAAAVHLVASKLFTEKGVFPPELVGKHKSCFDFVLSYLKARNVNWVKTTE